MSVRSRASWLARWGGSVAAAAAAGALVVSLYGSYGLSLSRGEGRWVAVGCGAGGANASWGWQAPMPAPTPRGGGLRVGPLTLSYTSHTREYARASSWPSWWSFRLLPSRGSLVLPGQTRINYAGAPLWAVSAGSGVTSALAWRSRRRGLALPHACPSCGYDSRGLASGAPCPECGRVPP